ncbi:FAS1-like dehydratase domain-containing protein [Actinophytocola sp.]|uniref:FAS1-like dehydratase domain-containing protein n=1 Tax=Actinophytocola sp. TaxID=1872138 RepID=UPI003D6B5B8A
MSGETRSEVRLVSREDIRKFAVATRVTGPHHHDVDAARARGYRDVVAPPYYFTALGLSFGRIVPRDELAESGLPVADPLSTRRPVAGECSVEWFGDIIAGDEIVVSERLVDIVAKQGQSGRMELYHYERQYRRGLKLLVRERFIRIAR